MKQSIVFIICVFALWSISANSGPQNVELRLSVDGTIEINPEGRVHDYAIETRLAPAIRDHIDQRVRQWRFEPIMEDGRAVIAKTRMQMELEALPDGENYQLRVSSVHFGSAGIPDRQSKRNTVRYPQEALTTRLGARVIVAVRLDPRGNVTDIHPYQISLSGRGSDGVEHKWRELFYRAVASKVKRWKFEPGELVNGAPIEGSVLVPFVFRIANEAGKVPEARWDAFVPGPVTPPPWQMVAGPDQDRLDGLKDGEAVALSSRFRLIDAVIGAAL